MGPNSYSNYGQGYDNSELLRNKIMLYMSRL